MRGLSMISRTLQTLHTEGKLTVRQFEDATGLSDSTFYRWLAGESEPTFIAVQQLIAHHPDGLVQAALIGAALRGSGFVAAQMSEDLDINGDGQVDMIDALAASNASIKVLAQMAEGLLEALSKENHKVQEMEVAHFQQQAAKAQRGVFSMVTIIETLHQLQSRRHKARAFAVPNGGVA